MPRDEMSSQVAPEGLHRFEVDDSVERADLFASLDGLPGDASPCVRPVDWMSLTAAGRRDELRRLRPFVAELVFAWAVDAKVVPPCWELHEPMVWLLSQVRDAYDVAFAETQTASASADWGRVWQWARAELRDAASATGCTTHTHQDVRPQAWAEQIAADGQAAWAWVVLDEAANADHERRVRREARKEALRVIPAHHRR